MEQAPSDPLALRIALVCFLCASSGHGSHPACCTPSPPGTAALASCSLPASAQPHQGPPGRTCTAGHVARPSPPTGPGEAPAYGLPGTAWLRTGAAPPASRREPGRAGAPGGLLQLLRGGLFALQRTKMPAARRALSWTPRERSVWVSGSLSPEGGRGPGSHAPRSLPTQRAQPQPLPPRLPLCTRPLLSVLPSRLCPGLGPQELAR